MAQRDKEKERKVAEFALSKAQECLVKRNDGRAFANLLLVLKLAPERSTDLQTEFLECLQRWGDNLRKAGRIEDLLKCQHEACVVLPNCPDLLNIMGLELFKLGFMDEAASYFRKSLRADPTFLMAQENLQNLSSHIIERWHFRMLNDSGRNMAYREAIHRAVSSGCDTVLDIGSGTGLLSMFAVDAGAKHVYACEVSKTMYEVSCDCVATNKMSDSICLLQKHSTEITVPEDLPNRVSLLVTETFDAGLLGEHIVSTMSHAWKHLLLNTESHSCHVIPQAASLYVCAVQSEEIRKQNRLLYPGLRHLEFGTCLFTSKIGLTDGGEEYEPYTCHRLSDLFSGYKYLSEVQLAKMFVFDDPKCVEEYHRGFSEGDSLTFTSQGHLDALVVWFDLHLDDNVTLTSAPDAESCWEQAVFPVIPDGTSDCSTLVRPGDSVTYRVQFKGDALQVKCSIVTRADIVMRADTLNNTNVETLNGECDTRTIQSDLLNHSSHTQDPHNDVTYFKLPQLDMSRLNDLTWNQAHCHALEEIKRKLPNSEMGFSVLSNLKGFSVMPLQALKVGAKEVCVITQDSMHEEALTHLADCNDISPMCVAYKDNLELVDGQFDVLVTDIVEPCGSLRHHILEDIALARMTCMSEQAIVLPQQVSVYALLVESDALVQDSHVISDERTLGFNVASFINDFQMTRHVDISLSTLKHEKLSAPFVLFDFDLNQPLEVDSDLEMTFLHHDHTFIINATETGNVNAVIYWFDLQLSDSVRYSTLDSSSHIHQGAVIQKQPFPVNEGMEIGIRALCKNSCMDVTLSAP